MAIQIYILSKLMKDNSYPYKLKKELSEPIPLDKLGGLTESKLYYHFETLAKKGLIESFETIKEENRPDKQVFAITAKGREELPKKIYQLFETADTISEMLVGIASIEYVERDKVVEILEKKLDNYIERWEQITNYDTHVQVGNDKEKLLELIGGYMETKVEHATFWLKELIKRIQQNEI
ncbi:PadR family transcriptional regulator [Psychrobacillus sp. INOP01]|uniref:PadR family transcriptional regulator n=1 Tax=Psychrobacillus sp. INOP01 TaxID=2829187 RepID=UPI001BA72479|nr:PadR family transcriptional regulator [Psychrobacillus sp. INOP01]QUG43227.1 PadR family transcriptional regulator [Psychrobacillus sp. INOP01]